LHKLLAQNGYGIMSEDTELTLEANPHRIEVQNSTSKQADQLDFHLVWQALDDESLRLLGRDHSARDADAAIAISMGTFSNVSLVIYGRPGRPVICGPRNLIVFLELDRPI
ncbi:hypothetical protein BASA61_003295, partial [Batrachochytrium salamandrivorans]